MVKDSSSLIEKETFHQVETFNIADLEKINRLGKGGFCNVTLVNTADKRRLAMKELHLEGFNSQFEFEEAAKDLIQEAAILQQVRHPNIVGLSGISDVDPNAYLQSFGSAGAYFLLMDVMIETLEDRLNRWYHDEKSWKRKASSRMSFRKASLRHLPKEVDKRRMLERIRTVVTKVVEAMEYLHENNIIFQDLKPENIGFEIQSDELKIFDFGMARNIDPVTNKILGEEEEMICGTPRYFAPEIFDFSGGSKQTDVYAFGIMLHEICSMSVPFSDMEEFEELQEHITGGGRPDIWDIPDETTRQLITDCTMTDPSLRPSFAELKAYRLPELILVEKELGTIKRDSFGLGNNRDSFGLGNNRDSFGLGSRESLQLGIIDQFFPSAGNLDDEEDLMQSVPNGDSIFGNVPNGDSLFGNVMNKYAFAEEEPVPRRSTCSNTSMPHMHMNDDDDSLNSREDGFDPLSRSSHSTSNEYSSITDFFKIDDSSLTGEQEERHKARQKLARKKKPKKGTERNKERRKIKKKEKKKEKVRRRRSSQEASDAENQKALNTKSKKKSKSSIPIIENDDNDDDVASFADDAENRSLEELILSIHVDTPLGPQDAMLPLPPPPPLPTALIDEIVRTNGSKAIDESARTNGSKGKNHKRRKSKKKKGMDASKHSAVMSVVPDDARSLIFGVSNNVDAADDDKNDTGGLEESDRPPLPTFHIEESKGIDESAHTNGSKGKNHKRRKNKKKKGMDAFKNSAAVSIVPDDARSSIFGVSNNVDAADDDKNDAGSLEELADPPPSLPAQCPGVLSTATARAKKKKKKKKGAMDVISGHDDKSLLEDSVVPPPPSPAQSSGVLSTAMTRAKKKKKKKKKGAMDLSGHSLGNSSNDDDDLLNSRTPQHGNRRKKNKEGKKKGGMDGSGHSVLSSNDDNDDVFGGMTPRFNNGRKKKKDGKKKDSSDDDPTSSGNKTSSKKGRSKSPKLKRDSSSTANKSRGKSPKKSKSHKPTTGKSNDNNVTTVLEETKELEASQILVPAPPAQFKVTKQVETSPQIVPPPQPKDLIVPTMKKKDNHDTTLEKQVAEPSSKAVPASAPSQSITMIMMEASLESNNLVPTVMNKEKDNNTTTTTTLAKKTAEPSKVIPPSLPTKAENALPFLHETTDAMMYKNHERLSSTSLPLLSTPTSPPLHRNFSWWTVGGRAEARSTPPHRISW